MASRAPGADGHGQTAPRDVQVRPCMVLFSATLLDDLLRLLLLLCLQSRRDLGTCSSCCDVATAAVRVWYGLEYWVAVLIRIV